jgi:copper homeostasis protein
MAIITEVCVDSAAGVVAARAGGADRVELCAALETGGLTPSPGLQTVAFAISWLPVHVLIRPRQGDFCYDTEDLATMEADVRATVAAGAAAVVIGALTPDGRVDRDVTVRLRDAAGGVPVTFHRAFDHVVDQAAGLDELVDLGVARVLTSGGRRSASDGADRLAELVRRADGNLIVLAGAGITPANAAALVRKTGVREIHFSARRAPESLTDSAHHEVVFGDVGPKPGRTDADLVAATVAAVAGL